jgi:Domain of unknown function (DUF397)
MEDISDGRVFEDPSMVSRVTLRYKSSYSGNNGGQCVEVGNAEPLIAVRDSKDPGGPDPSLVRSSSIRGTLTSKGAPPARRGARLAAHAARLRR